MRRLAAAGTMAVALLAAGCSGGGEASAPTTAVTVAPETTTTTEPPIEAGEQFFVYTPQVGDCFDRRQLDQEQRASAGDPTQIVLLLDCSLPHQNEVFTLVDYPNETDEFPGEEALERFARAACPVDFDAYVGKPYEESVLEIGFYFPSANDWQPGPRPLGCYLYDMSGAKLVGTMAGSAR